MTAAPDIAVAVLARPGADAAPARAALRAAGIEATDVVALAAPGAWAAARNAALERAGGADVLALIDDDVRVDPGWGAALRAAWAAADAQRLAVTSGPVRALDAPPWLAPEHGQVLGLWPGAGNVAFRIDALRGVGGFFPVRGHPDARDTFGDDRHAADELVAAGWHTEVVEGMSAARELAALGPTDLLRRRLRTGARSTALAPHEGHRAAGLALAARAGAAAAVRAARGDRRGALNRAAWAAQGVGAVLGGALAHAELQPDRARTALRATVPPPAPRPGAGRLRAWAPTRRRVHGAILLYHRVVVLDEDPLRLAVDPGRFAEQLAALRARWTPAPLEAVVAGEAGPHGVALTFDDGYHDNLLHALPALRDAGVPATLFASTGHVARGEGFWWDEVTRLLAEPGSGVLELELPEGTRAWAPADADRRATVRGHVHAALQTRDRATIAAACGALRAWAGDRPPPAAPAPGPERDRPLTVAELQELAAAGPFAVQAHGVGHLSLANAPADTRDAELRGSAADLEGWLGTRPHVFSYPFGVPGVDVDGPTRAAAHAAGYRLATVNAPGLVRAGGDPLALPRLAVPDVDGPAFERWLDAALPGR
jgi:peptidoglycan/xylan/chitin deacetylase (PgdA/CDA1 family)